MYYLPRREFIAKGSAALAALAIFHSRFAQAFPSRAGETVIPWLDQPQPNPVPAVIQSQLVWE
ncbi:sulfite oxidase, partial [Mesorhizobium abyssinicae]